MKEALYNYCLRLGDNSLILGHRLGEYSSHGPFLEEDLAITNVALDHIGQAEAFLTYAAEVKGDGTTEDDLAYKRPEHEFYNNLLVEQPNIDFAQLMVRQFFMDTFNYYLYSFLGKSADERIASIANKSIKEVSYHLKRSSEWMIRLGRGTTVSHQKMQLAIDHLWKYTAELFESTSDDTLLLQQGIACDLSYVEEHWRAHVGDILSQAGLKQPEETHTVSGSRKGYHTEHMGYLLAEMQFLPRTYSDAKW